MEMINQLIINLLCSVVIGTIIGVCCSLLVSFLIEKYINKEQTSGTVLSVKKICTFLALIVAAIIPAIPFCFVIRDSLGIVFPDNIIEAIYTGILCFGGFISFIITLFLTAQIFNIIYTWIKKGRTDER